MSPAPVSFDPSQGYQPAPASAAAFDPNGSYAPAPKKEEPGFLDKTIVLDSDEAAGQRGLQLLGRGFRNVYRGVKSTLDPSEDEKGNSFATEGMAYPVVRTAEGLADSAKGASQLPAATHDINQSPDPLGTYANVAAETAGEGAAQAITALGTEGAMRQVPKVLGAAKDAIQPVVDAATEKSITKLIKPNAADLKYGRDPAGAIVREGITGNSLEDLGPKVYDKAREVGSQIDAKLQEPAALAKTIDVSKALSPIDDELKIAVKNGNKGLYDKLTELKTQLTNDWAEVPQKNGPPTIAPTGPKNLQLNPYEATQFKRTIGDMTKWTGTDPFENDLNQVKAKIFGNIKDEVNSAVPDVADLNSRYSDLVQAGKAIERRVPVAARNSEFSLSDMGTAALASHLGGPVGVAAVAGKQLLGSTAFKTRAAQALHSEAGIYNAPKTVPASPQPIASPVTAVVAAPSGRRIVLDPSGRYISQPVTP